MKTMKKTIILSIAAMLLTALGTNISFAGKPAGKGGKVTVESATPNSVIQTQDENVTILGSGFDEGSTIRFLVTGTTDDSQIEVGPVEYKGPNELRVHIKTTGSTATVDYDVEVQATSGRKGKGTTLFKVQQADVACTELDPKEPTIAYVDSLDISGSVYTSDLYLSSDSGCEQSLLAEDVIQTLPEGVDENPNRSLQSVVWLRFATRNNLGVVAWADNNRTFSSQMGMVFEFDSEGTITPQSGGPSVFYLPTDGDEIWGGDVRINESDEIEIVLLERDDELFDRWLITYNVITGARETLISGTCPVRDSDETCLEVTWPAFWGVRGDEIYLNLSELRPDDPYARDKKRGVARMSKVDGVWTEPELLILNEGHVKVESVSSDGMLILDYEEVIRSKNGKIRGLRRSFGAISINDCEAVVCSPLDGNDLNIERDGKGYLVFTPDGRALVFDSGNRGQEGYIQEYLNPFTGEFGRTLIESVDGEFDSVR